MAFKISFSSNGLEVLLRNLKYLDVCLQPFELFTFNLFPSRRDCFAYNALFKSNGGESTKPKGMRNRKTYISFSPILKYESFATVGEIRVWWRADFQSGSRVLKKVF